MSLGLATGAISAGVGLASGISNAILSHKQFKYQKELNSQIMAREDNAVQRRAADLEAAGLSKTLAAGGAAQSGGSVSTGTAPSVDLSAAQSGAEMMFNSIRQKQDIARSQAETALINAKQRGEDLRNDFSLVKQLQEIEDHQAKMWNHSWYRERGLPSGIGIGNNYPNMIIAKYEANRAADFVRQQKEQYDLEKAQHSMDKGFADAHSRARTNSSYGGYGR